MRQLRRLIPLLLLFGLVLTPVPSAFAATFSVTTPDDELDDACATGTIASFGGAGDLSLREAICLANQNPDADTIELDTDTYTITIFGDDDTNESGDYDITTEITILSPGTVDAEINGQLQARHFHVLSGGNLTLQGNATNDLLLTFGSPDSGDSGGSIAVENDGTLELNFVEVSLSSTPLNGGGIYVATGGVITSMDQVIVAGNEVDEDGGGLYVAGTVTSITNALFDSNTTIDGDGGGIFVAPGGAIGSIEDANFVGNVAEDAGGGIRVEDGTITLISDSVIDGNFADDEGPGISVDGASASIGTIASTIISNNISDDLTPSDNEDGGGLHLSEGTINLIANSLFDGNIVLDDGGAIQVENDGRIDSIVNTDFVDNEAGDDGGAIEVQDSSIGLIANSFFDGNIAGALGGGINNENVIELITNTTITNNRANAGGGIFNEGSVTLEDSTVEGNDAQFGGGILNVGTLEIIGSTIASNISATGSAILNDEVDSVLTVLNSTITENQGPSNNSIAALDGSLTFNQVTIADNATAVGVAVDPGVSLTLINSIISGHGTFDYDGPTPTLQGVNIVEDGTVAGALAVDPQLAALADNGGPTETMLPALASPAVDATTCSVADDQRDAPRPDDLATVDNGGTCDIGAVELSARNEVLIEKAFIDPVIPSGGTSVLEFTISNPTDFAINDISFVDTLPAEITVVGVAGGGTCGDTIGAGFAENDGIPDANSVSPTGFDLGAGADCIIAYDVTATTPGTYTNSQANLTSLTGYLGDPATEPEVDLVTEDFSASLVVLGTEDQVAKLINGSVNAVADIGETVQVDLIIQREATGSGPEIVGYTDALPSNLVPGNPLNEVLIELAPDCSVLTGPGLVGTDIRGELVFGQNNPVETCVVLFDATCVAEGTTTNTVEVRYITSGEVLTASANITCGDTQDNNNRRPTDWDNGDDPVTVTGPDESSGALIIDVEADPTVISTSGQAITWTVTVTNISGMAFDPGELVTTVDDLFALQSVTGTQGISEIVGNQVFTQPGILEPNIPLVLTIPSIYTGAALIAPDGRAAQTDPGDLCAIGVIQDQSDTACVSLLPGTLPDTGGQPVGNVPLWALLAGIIALLTGGFAFRLRHRRV